MVHNPLLEDTPLDLRGVRGREDGRRLKGVVNG